MADGAAGEIRRQLGRATACWKDRVLTLESPHSIETQTLGSRGAYVSYPPGGTLQIYALHRLMPGWPLPTVIWVYGLALQALIALICGLLTFRMIEPPNRGGLALFFPIAASVTYLFQPVPYYFHPMVQLGYQAVLLPFAIAVYLEFVIRTAPRPGLLWLQAAVIGWMAALDWLFVPFGLALMLFRFISPLPSWRPTGAFRTLVGTSLQIWLLPTLICVAFVANVYVNGLMGELVSRALIRTAIAVASCSPSGTSSTSSLSPRLAARQCGCCLPS